MKFLSGLRGVRFDAIHPMDGAWDRAPTLALNQLAPADETFLLITSSGELLGIFSV